jgi:hypothetical protein
VPSVLKLRKETIPVEPKDCGMADVKLAKMASASATTKSKRQAKNSSAEDPYATARIRAIFDPEQAELIASRLEEIQTSGATVTLANAVEGSIERIVNVGGSPAVVGLVYL